MYLKKINIQNFKNIGEARIEFSPALNCISGDNGEGKTNLLDAIFYLSMTKSYFSSSEQYTRTTGQRTMVLSGEYDSGDGSLTTVAVMLDGDNKQVRCNKKNYTKFSDHIGKFPIVMISPSDTSLINESAEARRRFLNMMLSQTDRESMRALQNYNKLLLYRNRLLKEDAGDSALLEKRMKGLYAEDERKCQRFSHENADVKALYDEYLGQPGSERAHHLLHTKYHSK